MKIWILTSGNYKDYTSNFTIEHVFSSKDKLDEYLKLMKDAHLKYNDPLEVELDDALIDQTK